MWRGNAIPKRRNHKLLIARGDKSGAGARICLEQPLEPHAPSLLT